MTLMFLVINLSNSIGLIYFVTGFLCVRIKFSIITSSPTNVGFSNYPFVFARFIRKMNTRNELRIIVPIITTYTTRAIYSASGMPA